jgi:hypothetical protein
MIEQNQVASESDWKRFIKKHKTVFAVFVTAAILAVALAVYVFVWFTGNAQTTGLVPSSLGMWSMGSIVTFILNAIFWELLVVGIPVGIGAVAAWQWWKLLPEEEKNQYHLSGKRSKSRGAGGAISPLLFIAFAIKVFVDGNWNAAISTWTLNYVVGSMVTILMWTVAIFAIPAIIGIVWWISHKTDKTQ